MIMVIATTLCYKCRKFLFVGEISTTKLKCEIFFDSFADFDVSTVFLMGWMASSVANIYRK
jgi:hypothetical protein